MIVFINTLDKTVTICDKIVKVYPWSKIKEISEVLRDKEVLYVTDVVTVSGDEVIDAINTSFGDEDIGDQTYSQETELFVHCTKGKLIAVYNGKEHVFGITDFKPLLSLPEGMLDKCRILVEGLKSGLVKIVNETEKDYILQQREEQQEIKRDRINRQGEIIKGSVDDPISIDLGSSGNFKRGNK